MLLNSPGALIDLCQVEHILFVSIEPVQGSQIIPRVAKLSVVDGNASKWGLDHFNADALINGGLGM